jgi:hypothetical protein
MPGPHHKATASRAKLAAHREVWKSPHVEDGGLVWVYRFAATLQKCFGRPACLSTPLAVCRDKIL